MRRTNIVPIWKFFTKSLRGDKVAICNYCSRPFSYKTTITNLKCHLRVKHKAHYNHFIKLTNRINENITNPLEDEESELEEREAGSEKWEEEVKILQIDHNQMEDRSNTPPSPISPVASSPLPRSKPRLMTRRQQSSRTETITRHILDFEKERLDLQKRQIDLENKKLELEEKRLMIEEAKVRAFERIASALEQRSFKE